MAEEFVVDPPKRPVRRPRVKSPGRLRKVAQRKQVIRSKARKARKAIRGPKNAPKVLTPKKSRLKGVRDRKVRGGRGWRLSGLKAPKLGFKGLGRLGGLLAVAKKVARSARRAGLK